jgi:hypothetical protein
MKTLTSFVTLAVSVAVVLAPTAVLAQWVKIDSAKPATVYADPSSIKRVGSFARMWELIDYHQLEDFAGQAFRSSRVLREFDCDTSEMRTLAFTIFTEQMAHGDVVHSHRADRADWEFVEPYSLGESSFRMACKVQ